MDLGGHLVGSLTLAVTNHSITMFSDVSKRAWGTVFVKDGQSQQIRDYWIDLADDINVLEARAIRNALSSLFALIRKARIDVWTDNVTLRAAWENGGCRSSPVNQEIIYLIVI